MKFSIIAFIFLFTAAALRERGFSVPKVSNTCLYSVKVGQCKTCARKGTHLHSSFRNTTEYKRVKMRFDKKRLNTKGPLVQYNSDLIKPWSIADSFNSTTLRFLLVMKDEVTGFWLKMEKKFESWRLIVSSKVERDVRTTLGTADFVSRTVSNQGVRLFQPGTGQQQIGFIPLDASSQGSQLLGGFGASTTKKKSDRLRRKRAKRLPESVQRADMLYRSVRVLPNRLQYDFQRRVAGKTALRVSDDNVGPRLGLPQPRSYARTFPEDFPVDDGFSDSGTPAQSSLARADPDNNNFLQSFVIIDMLPVSSGSRSEVAGSIPADITSPANTAAEFLALLTVTLQELRAVLGSLHTIVLEDSDSGHNSAATATVGVTAWLESTPAGDMSLGTLPPSSSTRQGSAARQLTTSSALYPSPPPTDTQTEVQSEVRANGRSQDEVLVAKLRKDILCDLGALRAAVAECTRAAKDIQSLVQMTANSRGKVDATEEVVSEQFGTKPWISDHIVQWIKEDLDIGTIKEGLRSTNRLRDHLQFAAFSFQEAADRASAEGNSSESSFCDGPPSWVESIPLFIESLGSTAEAVDELLQGRGRALEQGWAVLNRCDSIELQRISSPSDASFRSQKYLSPPTAAPGGFIPAAHAIGATIEDAEVQAQDIGELWMQDKDHAAGIPKDRMDFESNAPSDVHAVGMAGSDLAPLSQRAREVVYLARPAPLSGPVTRAPYGVATYTVAQDLESGERAQAAKIVESTAEVREDTGPAQVTKFLLTTLDVSLFLAETLAKTVVPLLRDGGGRAGRRAWDTFALYLPTVPAGLLGTESATRSRSTGRKQNWQIFPQFKYAKATQK